MFPSSPRPGWDIPVNYHESCNFTQILISSARLKTGDRTQFLKLPFYIYFGIWSFIHSKVKIYTFIKWADYIQGCPIYCIKDPIV